MLGGSSSHNGLVYNRGNSLDYDKWAEITNDPSWRYDAILKFFKKAETYKGIYTIGHQHGRQGPLTIETLMRPIHPLWKAAAAELGYKVIDPNAPQKPGFAYEDATSEIGRRVSTFEAYINPILHIRKKLHVVKYAQVDKILLKDNIAIGVRYTKHGIVMMAQASKEVIVSGGAIATPILLMKSGIGPSSILNNAKIPKVRYLPVGTNLQDHPGVLLGPFAIDDPSVLSNIRNNLTIEDFEKYINFQREDILSNGQSGPQAFLVSSFAKKRREVNWPDFQLFLLRQNIDRVNPAFYIPTNEFSLIVFAGRPEYKIGNFGSITMDTSAYRRRVRDIERLVKLDFNFLHSKQDFDLLLEGIQSGLKIFNTKPFEAIGTKLKPNAECAKEYTFKTKEYWRCIIERNGRNSCHTCCTCRMGHGPSDKNAVVDSKLRVLGVARLRVVDASIIPQVTNSNMYAPVVVLAEKASEDILRQQEIPFIPI